MKYQTIFLEVKKIENKFEVLMQFVDASVLIFYVNLIEDCVVPVENRDEFIYSSLSEDDKETIFIGCKTLD